MVTGGLKTKLSADLIVLALCRLLKLSVVSQASLRATERFDQASHKGDWKAPCVFVVQRGPFTVVENLSGCLGGLTKLQWTRLASAGDFTYLEYNDAIPYAQFVEARKGQLRDYYLFDGDDQQASGKKFQDWVAIASLVDDDDELFLEESAGTLYLLGKRRAKRQPARKPTTSKRRAPSPAKRPPKKKRPSRG